SIALAITVAMQRARPSQMYGLAVFWALVAIYVQNGATVVGIFAIGAAIVVAALTLLRFKASQR
ncbi:MAG: hypothetical protein WBA02_12570, partial [Jannaschia helgolandensis]